MVTPKTMIQISAVKRCVEVIVNSFLAADAPRAYTINTTPQGETYKNYLPNQPQVLQDPGPPGMGLTEFMTQVVSSLCLFGEAFLYAVEFDNMMRPLSLEPLNPMLVTIGDNMPGGDPDAIYYGNGSSRQKLDADKVTHIKGLTLPSAKRAQNPVNDGAPSFALALAAVDFGSRWFSQGASPGFTLSTDQRIGKDEIKRVAEQFLMEHSGLSNSHLPLVLDSGLKPAALPGGSADDAGFLNTVNAYRAEIAGMFGVPAHLLNMAELGAGMGKTLQEANFSFVDFTLNGYKKRLDEAFTTFLPKGVFADTDLTVIQQADSANKSTEIQAVRTTAIMTVNEMRMRFYNMGPVEGGDDITMPLASNVGTNTGNPGGTNNANGGASV